jgi:hypothetical protein
MTVSIERRLHAPRLRCHLKAQVVLPFQKTVLCLVTEISPAGARLNVDPHQALPAAFAIQLFSDETLFYCDLVWRKGSDAGVTIPADQWRFWWLRSQAFNRWATAQ